MEIVGAATCRPRATISRPYFDIWWWRTGSLSRNGGNHPPLPTQFLSIGKHPENRGENMQKFYKNSVEIHDFHTKNPRFAVFWGKFAHFMGFPPNRPLFHRNFTPIKRKTVETPPSRTQKVGKRGVNLSHFPRSFPLKNRRKPLILRGFRHFSTVCSQVEIRGELY